jgi:hypothetical protein
MIPEKWYLPITKQNFSYCKQWRKQFETTHNNFFEVDTILLSEHYNDKSKLYLDVEELLNKTRPEYKKITTEQFIKYVLNKNNETEFIIKCL